MHFLVDTYFHLKQRTKFLLTFLTFLNKLHFSSPKFNFKKDSYLQSKGDLCPS